MRWRLGTISIAMRPLHSYNGLQKVAIAVAVDMSLILSRGAANRSRCRCCVPGAGGEAIEA